MYLPDMIRKEALRRGLRPKTIIAYSYCIKRFFRVCNKDLKQVNKQDIKDFLDKLIEKDACGSTVNLYLNALKFLYENVLNKKLIVKIRFSRTAKSLPSVLSQSEVKALFEAIENKKHKLMIRFLYSAGLRVSELVNLRVEHLDFENNFGIVKNGKGGKDRYFVIAKSIRDELIEHIKGRNLSHESFLFRGINGPYSTSSIRAIIKDASYNAKIQKNVHPHTLRHSFSTHLLENGYDVASVQSLLGHSNINTTMIYVHMASPKMIDVISPIDNL